jgi:hypothetical protein
MLCLAVFALVLGANLTPTVAAQQDGEDEKITAGERREAKRLARRFVKRLRETRDISPLITEFFVDDFSPQNCILLSERDDAELISQLSPEERLQCFTLEFNLVYLALLNLMATYPPDSDSEPALEEYFPPDALEMIREDPQLAHWAGVEMDDEELQPQIENPDQLRALLSTLEKVVRRMQEYMTQYPPEESPYFKENFRQEKADIEAFEPDLEIITEADCSLPVGARVVSINIPFFIPFFHLDLVASDDGLKVFRLRVLVD